jgi:glycerol-3-phosphate dehydrogenase subunit C
LTLLSLIPDLNLVDSHASCCGIAGTYGYKSEKYDISMDVGKPLFDFISNDMRNSPVVVCDSETCRWQITHATGKPAIHPVELLAKSYGITVDGALL